MRYVDPDGDRMVDELVFLASRPRGIYSADIRHCQALLEHPAIRGRRLDPDPSHAVSDALAELSDKRVTALADHEHEAAMVLLYADGRYTPEQRARSDFAGVRADIAAQLLYPGSNRNRAYLRQPRGGRTPERELLRRLRLALDRLDAPSSSTSSHGATDATGGGLPIGHAQDLLGTWRGTTVSQAPLLKHPRVNGPREVTSFLVFAAGDDGVTVTYLVEHGYAVVVAQRIAPTSAGRRLIAVYENFVNFGPDQNRPVHRGTMLLEIYCTPAERLVGPYFNDRRRFGELRYAERRDDCASSFNDAVALYG